MKRCGKCGNEKPLEDFYVDRRAKDGRTYACKPCVKAANAESKAKVPIDIQRERWRNQNKNTSSRAAKKRYRSRNVAKYQDLRRQWREDNAEKVKQQWIDWYAENRDRVLEHRRANYDAEKKRLARDPEAGQRYSAERRARLAGLPSEKINRAELYKRDNGTCQICKQPVPEKGWEMDHIVPIFLGGPHLWHNVQVTCRTCNRRKGRRLEGQIALPAA